MKKTVYAMVALGIIAAAPAFAETVPGAGGLYGAATATEATKIHDWDDWHNRWRSHNRWGSHGEWSGGWGWHSRWRSHYRWGSDRY
jgi:hypothetical protein